VLQEEERVGAALVHAFEAVDREIMTRCRVEGTKGGATGLVLLRLGESGVLQGGLSIVQGALVQAAAAAADGGRCLLEVCKQECGCCCRGQLLNWHAFRIVQKTDTTRAFQSAAAHATPLLQRASRRLTAPHRLSSPLPSLAVFCRQSAVRRALWRYTCGDEPQRGGAAAD
jgi:hypothetical protein